MRAKQYIAMKEELYSRYEQCRKTCIKASIFYGNLTVFPIDFDELLELMDSVENIVIFGPESKLRRGNKIYWKQDNVLYICSNLGDINTNRNSILYTVPFWKPFIEDLMNIFKIKKKHNGKIIFKKY